jgi:ketosteroid isomerase-like protein
MRAAAPSANLKELKSPETPGRREAGCTARKQKLERGGTAHATDLEGAYAAEEDPVSELAAKKAASPPGPEEWPRLFGQSINAGDLEAALALYEPNASFVASPDETIVGHAGLRRVLAELIDKKARMRGRVIKAIPAGDVALLYTDWEGTTVDPSGETTEVRSKAIELVRRQPDGAWKLVVGDPNARG